MAEIYRVFEVKKYYDFDNPRQAEEFIDTQSKEDEFGIVPSFVTRQATYEELNETVAEMEDSNFKGTPSELTTHMDRITAYKKVIKEMEENFNQFEQIVNVAVSNEAQRDTIIGLLSKFSLISATTQGKTPEYSVNLHTNLIREELVELLKFLA